MKHVEVRRNLTALAINQELNLVFHDVAGKAAQQWAEYPGFAGNHMKVIRAVLDGEEPEYRK